MTPDHRLLAMEAIYDGFVSAKKGPAELNRKSFDETFEFLAAENSYGRWPTATPFHEHPLPQLKLLLMDRKAGLPLHSAEHYSRKLEQLS